VVRLLLPFLRQLLLGHLSLLLLLLEPYQQY
jgi:hypothetical protein